MSTEEKPVICLVKHLSPIERLLNRSAFDSATESYSSSRFPSLTEKDLLRVEIGKTIVLQNLNFRRMTC